MEIGSVLELDDFVKYQIPENGNAFWLPFMRESVSYHTVLYQSGRNAIEDLLSFLMAEKGIKTVLLPDYMCGTVREAAQRAGMNICTYKVNRFYEVDRNELASLRQDDACIFVAQYFGKKMNQELVKQLKDWQAEGSIIIEDLTLSIFSKDDASVGFGNYIVGSIRKYLPIPDGGFLCSTSDEMPILPKTTVVSKYTDYYFAVQAMKKQYIDGGCIDKELKSCYLGYYNLSIKELFSDYAIYPISDWSANYISQCDIREIVRKRQANYDYLYGKLEHIKGIEIQVKREGEFLPFGMLILTEKRNELLDYLISKEIYCNVHWRLDGTDENPDMEYLAKHTMTIPCDQRYSFSDMDRIAEVIKEWMEANS